MSTVCISNCVDDAKASMRANYVNLYKWPESDTDFVKMVHQRAGPGLQHQAKVVDRVSCRQMYLKSYTFSKKESVPERTKKCFGNFSERTKNCIGKKKRKIRSNRKRIYMVKTKKATFSAFSSVFQKFLSCTANLDVVDR